MNRLEYIPGDLVTYNGNIVTIENKKKECIGFVSYSINEKDKLIISLLSKGDKK